MIPGAISISLSTAAMWNVRSVRPSGSCETSPVSQSVSIAEWVETVSRYVDVADADHRAVGGDTAAGAPLHPHRNLGGSGVARLSSHPLAERRCRRAAASPPASRSCPIEFLLEEPAPLPSRPTPFPRMRIICKYTTIDHRWPRQCLGARSRARLAGACSRFRWRGPWSLDSHNRNRRLIADVLSSAHDHPDVPDAVGQQTRRGLRLRSPTISPPAVDRSAAPDPPSLG